MYKISKLLLVIVVVCFLTGTASAQLQFSDFKQVAQAGFKFLTVDKGARNTAMGGAAFTNEGDPTALFWNPAGIVLMDEIAFYAGYTQWIVDMEQVAIGAVVPVGSFGTFGISFSSFNFGDMQSTRIPVEGDSRYDTFIGYVDLGTISPSAYVVGLTYGRSLTNRFQIALTAKYAQEDLVVMKKGSMAFDFGTIYHAGIHDIKIAATMQHFAFNQVKYIEEDFMLPLTFHVAFSADMLSLTGFKSEKSKLIMAIDGSKPRDFSERVHLGTEYIYNDFFALRAGYKFNYDSEGFTAGFGIKYGAFKLDYSFIDFSDKFSNVSYFDLFFSL